jgi:sugar phosphate isomerase/epimerase
MRFGISTHLYHDERLTRDHLAEIAAHGFEWIELFATRSHFDYHDDAAIAALGTWLAETGLSLHGVHAPVMASYSNGEWGRAFSIAAGAAPERDEAIAEIDRSLDVMRRLGGRFLVVHLGLPGTHPSASRDTREAGRRSLEQVHALAEAANVRLALEVIPNGFSAPAALAALLEEDLDLPGAGICLDFGHAFLLGDLTDAIETVSGLVLTTHVHDNRGKKDEHLVPFEGAIDWPGALTATLKIGYEDTMMLEVGRTAPSADVLARSRRACDRFERLTAVQPLNLEP